MCNGPWGQTPYTQTHNARKRTMMLTHVPSTPVHLPLTSVIQAANGSGRGTAAVRVIGSGENESEGEVKAGSEFAVTYLPPSRSLTTLHHPQRRLRQSRKKLLGLVHCCRLHSKGHPYEQRFSGRQARCKRLHERHHQKRPQTCHRFHR